MKFHFVKKGGVAELEIDGTVQQVRDVIGLPDSTYRRWSNRPQLEDLYETIGVQVGYDESNRVLYFQFFSPAELIDDGVPMLSTPIEVLRKQYDKFVTSEDGTGFVCKDYGFNAFHSAFDETDNEPPEAIFVCRPGHWR